MKTLLILSVACFAAVSCTVILKKDGMQTTVTKDLLEKQRDLITLLTNVNMPNTNVDQVKIAKEYDIYMNIDKYNNVKAVKEFLTLFQQGFLNKYKVFTLFEQKHKDQVIALFHMFFYAKDFETFYKTACWAREYVNEGMFVYALTVAVMHREDCRGLVLPPAYEIYPFFFLNKDVIQKGQILNLRRGDLNEKMAETFGIHKIDNTLFIDTEYTNKINEDTMLTYFTEDIGLNSYFYYFHVDYPFWMQGKMYGINKTNRGETFYYFVQQLLARYYMERLSNNLGEIRTYNLDMPTKIEYFSNLRHGNGYDFETTMNRLDMDKEENVMTVRDMLDGERRIKDAIRSGFVLTETGKFVNIKTKEGINILGNLINENMDSVNMDFYKYTSVLLDQVMRNTLHKDNMITTTTFNFETILRNPTTYEIFKNFMCIFINYKNMLPSYTREQLAMNEVKIENVMVDKLVTFFDTFDVNMKNALNLDTIDNKMTTVAKLQRLNHNIFDIKIDVNSEVTKDVVVRIFLGPKFDNEGKMININDNRFNFFELDTFLYTLKTGKQTIVRNCREFTTVTKDQITTDDIVNFMTEKINMKLDDTLLTVNERLNLFPERLVLPKGKKNGMAFQVYVIISNTQGTTNDKDFYTTETTMNTLGHKLDGRALGYPFDRKINENVFENTNMFVKDVTIYHKTVEDKTPNTFVMNEMNVNNNYNTKNTMNTMNTMDTKTTMNTMNTMNIKDNLINEDLMERIQNFNNFYKNFEKSKMIKY